MKRTRPPQPTALKILRGNPGCRRLNQNEPDPPGRPEPPAYLKGEARKKWDSMVPTLERAGIMKSTDSETLARYCALWELWLGHYQACRRGNYKNTLLNPDGSIKYEQTTPDATQLLKLNQQLLRLEQEFGLTPSARAGVSASNPHRHDDLGKFLEEA